jgi:type I restriction-modification system DNA methylase subunit
LIEFDSAEKKADFKKIKSDSPAFSNFLSDWSSQGETEDIWGLLSAIRTFTLPENEPDFLGAVYESMRNLGEKSKLGAFFTPSSLVYDLKIPASAKVLDPCSGTGTILLSIIDPLQPPKEIHLRDIDELALRIAKVNFALFFNNTNLSVYTACENALIWQCSKEFDFIITNPPWGALRDEATQETILKQNSGWKKADSFDIILSQALKKLSPIGKLVFILPESLLHVDTHFAIRKRIFETAAEIEIRYFGNAFRGVQSKVIRLEIDKAKQASLSISRENKKFILSDNLLIKNNFRVPAVHNVFEMQLLEKILSNHRGRLKGSTFGLGIVTGNNKKYILKEKIPGSEAIYTGKELQPFGFSEPCNLIRFKPEQLQQCAPEALYRSPKICYRFISDKLLMVADSEGLLVLNSVNFFIPPVNFNLKALATFFNSPICSFLYQRLFNSVKVLRSHLENIPLPDAYFQNEKALEQLYIKAENGCDVKDELFEISCKIFEVDVNEFKKLIFKKLS